MRVEMTVVDGARGGPGVDVVVAAPPGTPLVAVLADLAAACGRVGAAPDPGGAVVAGVPVAPAAPLGVPPLVRGAVVVVGRSGAAGAADPATDPATGAPRRAGTPSVLHVVGGPGAGAVLPLPLGRSFPPLPPGGGAAAGVRLELDASPSGTRVRDAGPGGGCRLDGAALGGAWRLLVPGALVELGRTRVRLAPPRADGAAGPSAGGAVSDGSGQLVMAARRALPATEEAGTAVVVDLPAPPVPRDPAPLAWPAVLAPVLVAVPLALLWSPLALVLALSGPLVAVLTRGGESRSGRRRHRDALAEHARATAAARSRARRLAARERDRLDRCHPDPAAVGLLAAARGSGVWCAPPGAPLAVRVGSARVPTAVVLRSAAPGAPAGRPEDDDERVHLPAGPLVVDLADLEQLAVEAPEDVGEAAVRGLLGQLAVLHSPEDLRLLVLSDRPAAWTWLRWLPHAEGGGALPRSAPTTPPHGASRTARTVVVDDGGPGAGVRLWVRGPAGDPRGAGRAVLRLAADGSGTWRGHRPWASGPDDVDGADEPLALVADLVSASWVERLARDLAPLRREAALTDSRAPSLRELLAAHGPDPADADAVARSWSRGVREGRRAELPLGVCADGAAWTVDLERDGPHALVAGTTGSGKSTLLVSLVLAMAVAEPPDELAVVVVDYKGGATASRLRGLPHLAGAVTDLDEHLARRALESLRAEVRRRERVLAEHGAVDRAALLARRADGARLLPRLLVVVDEVRVLAEEVPDLVPGLVRLAAVGRSLGVHLVLATQRPAGVVSSDARANTNLRIALRVRDVPDSLDVVDDPGAAHLPPSCPGAALVRRGGEALQEVRVASTTRHRPPAVAVTVLETGTKTGTGTGAGADGDGADDGDDDGDDGDEVPVVVAALARAARGRARTAPPWLPPLPDVLGWRTPDDAASAVGGTGGGLPLGVADDPAVPEQRPLAWAGEGPLVVAGGPGTGRTSLLRWLAAAARDREVHVVGDTAELGHLAALPWVAGVVDASDGEHLLRVLTAVAGARASGPAGGAAPLLLVDRADRLLAAQPGDAGPERHATDAAADLLRRVVDGGGAVVLTGDPSLLTSRAVATVREVLLLSPADRTAALLAGVPGAALPVHWPAGRALRLRSGPVRECQLPLLGGAAAAGTDRADGAGRADGAAVQRAVVAELASGWAAAPRGRAAVRRLPPLPRELLLDDHPWTAARHDRGRRTDSLVVGLGGAEVLPVDLPLPAGAGAVVVGAAGSGRTGALRLLALQAQRAGRRVVAVLPRGVPAGPPGGPAHADVVVHGTGAAAARQLADALEEPVDGGAPAGLVLVDDAELVAGTAVEGVLLTLLEAPDLPWAVVAAGTSGLLPAHRGLVAALRRHRTGLLLHPLAPGDAEVLGVRASPVRGGPPGRASAVVAGALVVVQLARA